MIDCAVASDPLQILIVAPPARKRESLVTQLRSVNKSVSIQIADSCQQAADRLTCSMPACILIDYSCADPAISEQIAVIHRNHPQTQIVLLRNHASLKKNDFDITLRDMAYDEITLSVLEQLVNQIIPASVVPSPKRAVKF